MVVPALGGGPWALGRVQVCRSGLAGPESVIMVVAPDLAAMIDSGKRPSDNSEAQALSHESPI
jgi:hypothetical protein